MDVKRHASLAAAVLQPTSKTEDCIRNPWRLPQEFIDLTANVVKRLTVLKNQSFFTCCFQVVAKEIFNRMKRSAE